MLESRLDDLLKPLVPARTPGIAVVVQRGTETLYRKAFGSADLAGKTPLTPATPMKVGSLSKAFTAVVVQGLAREGRLSLDDSITRWFPSAPAGWKPITVRNLLNHTSGLVSYTEIPSVMARIGGPGTQEDIVRAVMKAEPKFAPGTRFEYSNTNYNLLGLIAEKAGGAPLEALMERRIFGPLGMTSASLERSGTYRKEEARGSYHVKGRTLAMPPVDMSWPYAAGSVVASADDLAKWLAAIAGGKVLNERERAEAFSPSELKDGSLSFYGFGWVLGTRGDAPLAAPLIGHEGKINGFTSYVAYLPASDVRAAIVTNTYDGVPAQRIAYEILDAVEGKPLPRNPSRTATRSLRRG